MEEYHSYYSSTYSITGIWDKNRNAICDICVLWSGAGAGPIIYELAGAGKKLIVLEKGEHYKWEDFCKDEIAYTKRNIVSPNLIDECHSIIENNDEYAATQANWDFWNGYLVGGSYTVVSGFFHRLHLNDFHLKTKFGTIKGGNIEDWPISVRGA